MKKCLKQIIIVTAIIYFILSLGYTVITKIEIRDDLLALETDSIYNEMNFTDSEDNDFISFRKNILSGEKYVLNDNLQMLIVSVAIGIIVGLIKSVKENSWVKYILMFIFGNIIYTSIWTIIKMLIFKEIGGMLFQGFFDEFMEVETLTFISYLIVYISITLAIIVNNKVKVENLNKTLKNPQKEDKRKIKIDNKKLKKIIISILVIIFIIVAIIITRRSIILIKYAEKVNEINSYTNYYLKEESKLADGQTFTTETYVKDGVWLDKSSQRYISYRNKNTKESFSYNYNTERLFISKEDTFIFRPLYMLNNFCLDLTVRKMQNIIFAFNVKITSENCNGKDCYVIKYNGNKTYVDKDTYLVVRETQEGSNKAGIDIFDYIFEEGVVTDKDVQKPQISR